MRVTVDPVLDMDEDDVPFIEQDRRDGAALRRLREALPEGMLMHFAYDDFGWTVVVSNGEPHVRADTIAEAADKCREALG